jgi:electron-transferring-flavoprotein dehydrogenase
MSVEVTTTESPEIDRQSMEVDIACAGFGPATGGFLSTLTKAWTENPADPAFESRVTPGMPLQVLCYERADDISSGVSGVVTQAGRSAPAFLPSIRPKSPWPSPSPANA